MTIDNLKPSLKAGFYGGVVALFISVIGMVETFSQRDIVHGVLTVGHALLVIVTLVTGYTAAGQMRKALYPPHAAESSERASRTIVGSLLAGLVIGLMLALLVVMANVIDLRTVLINVSPDLIAMLTLDRSTMVGAVVPLVLGVALAGLGGSITLLRSDIRRITVTSLLLMAFLGLISEVIRISLLELGLPPRLSKVFITTKGLTPVGTTIILVVIIAAISLARRRRRGRLGARIEQLPPARQRTVRHGSWVLIFVFLLVLPWVVGRVVSDVLLNVGIFILMGFGLNIVVGQAGLLDLGYVAFFAVGAYTMAILTSPDEIQAVQLGFWAALPIVIAVTGLAGLLIGAPVLRMRGDYLAIVTLGFGEIARFLALSDWFKPVLGGAQGVIKIPNISIGGVELVGPQNLYYLILVFCLIALFISWRLEGSRVGRAWVAMREDEQVAESMGVNTVYYKLLAFAIGGMIASLSGAVFAVKLSAIFPHSFDVEVSITALSLIIIGGIGSLPGVLVGAFALVGLPELLREFEEYRLLLYGAVIIYMMIVRPEGLMPSVRRARELHEEEIAQDAWGRQTEAVPDPPTLSRRGDRGR